MISFFRSIFLFSLLHLAFSAEQHNDPAVETESIIKEKVNALLKISDNSDKFLAQASQFAYFYSEFNNLRAIELIILEFKKQPAKFILRFVKAVSRLFTNDDLMGQVCDLLFIYGHFLSLENFSVINLGEKHFQAGQSIMNFLSKKRENLGLVPPHVRGILEEYLGHFPEEDIILFSLFFRGGKRIEKYLGVLRTEIGPDFNFELFNLYCQISIYIYKQYLDRDSSPILKRLSDFSNFIHRRSAFYALVPIMNLNFGLLTFQKLFDYVKLNGLIGSAANILSLPPKYHLAYFIILDFCSTTISLSQEALEENPSLLRKAQKALNELTTLIDQPFVWIRGFPTARKHSLAGYIVYNYLTRTPLVTGVTMQLSELYYILKDKHPKPLTEYLGQSS